MRKKVLKGSYLLDCTGNGVINKPVLVINEEGRIEKIGKEGEIQIPEGKEVDVYDLEGKFILPGLIDAHVHIDLAGMADTYKENLVEDKLRSIRAAKAMEKTLYAGFTTVRNVGSVNYIDISVKEAIQEGWVIGPRIITSGMIISITCSGTEYFDGLYRVADGYHEFKKAAREQLKMGADCLKVMATGAVMNPGGIPGAEQPDIEEIKAIVEEAKKLGKKVAAHAHGAQGIKNAVIAGVDTIEHGSLADDEAINMMAERGVYLVPTLVVGYFFLKYGIKGGIPSFMIEKAKEMQQIKMQVMRKAIEAGVKIAMGTDAGTPYNYHGSNAHELMVYVEEGLMTEEEAIVSATRTAAEACGLEHEVGTLEEGKIADILVIEGNPLKDISVLLNQGNICMILKEGKILKEKAGK